MNNRYSDFIQANRGLWDKIPTREDTDGLLLVESVRHPIISHANAVFARVIKEANGLSIGWIDSGDPEIQERLMSYDSTSRTVSLYELTLSDWLAIGSRFVRSALKMLLSKDILSFSLDGIRFGDILYDSYLASYKVATIHRVNKGVLKILLILIRNYYRFKKTLQDCNASAVLVAHFIGTTSGVLMRTALHLGIPVYNRTFGNNKVALNLRDSISDTYLTPYGPRPIDMQMLSSIDQERLNREFQDLMEGRTSGSSDKDAKRAYSESKKTYHSKEQFSNEFQVSVDRKFVFVMLHAFNDHPHSHYGGMIFNDYYDWFVKTLEFAKTKPDVIWIFKEHPTAIYYPTRDISLADHFTACPDHIVFMDRDSSFNAKSLLYLADLIITVAGTAGIEFAAAAGVPSILAGRTIYSGHGFTIEPKTRTEYFQVLSEIETITKLSEEQRDVARKVFLYIQRYSHDSFSWSPLCLWEETKDPDLDDYYWERVVQVYREKPGVLVQEFNDYVRRVNASNFRRLAGL